MDHPIRSMMGIIFSGLSCVSAAGCGAGDAADDAELSASSPLTASQSFLVSFSGGSIPADTGAAVAAAGGTVIARYSAIGVLLARATSATFASTLRASGSVDAVGAVTAVHSSIGPVRVATPVRRESGADRGSLGDPLSFRQWNMDQIRAPQARSISVGDKSVLVGVLDSGIDVTHPDMVGQVDMGASVSCVGGIANSAPEVWSNDIIGHGTHVSGIIAGARNGVGVVGVAPGVRLAAVKVANDDVNDPNFGFVFADAVVCALDWAVSHGFDLMNASLTIDPFTGPIDGIFCSDQPDRAAIVKIVRQSVLLAARKKITLLASTGNSFTDLARLTGSTPGADCKVLPVQLPKVIGVSAVSVTQTLAFYSNYGFGAVDLAAPGGDSLVPDPRVTDRASSGQVVSSIPRGSLLYQAAADWDGQVEDCSSGTCSTYAYLQGTSQATPHVTGVAALALSRFGRVAPDTLLAILRLTATPLACPRGPYDPGQTGMPATCKGPRISNSFYGSGEVDALRVVR